MLIAWKPRQMPTDRDGPSGGGRPGLRLELIAIGLDIDRPADRLAVAGRVDVGATRQEQAVHRGERRVPCRLVGGRVERDRLAAVTLDPVEIETVLAIGDVRFGLVGGHGQGDDDPRAVHAREDSVAVRDRASFAG